MAYDERIIDIARIAAVAAGKNASVAPQLLSADIIFTLADAVEDGRLILGRGRDSDGSGVAGETAKTGSTEGDSAGPEGIAQKEPRQ